MENETKRFSDLKEKSTEELIKELNEAKEDLIYLKEKIEANEVTANEKSEYLNSDIPFDRDKIEYIENELKGRGIN